VIEFNKLIECQLFQSAVGPDVIIDPFPCSEVLIEPAPNPITAKLKVGDVLELRLPTIPAEGYTWQPQDLDAKILRQEGEAEYIADKGPNASGGVTTVRFKALAAGSTSLTLIYANPKAASGLGLSSQSFGLSVEVESGD